MEYIDIGEKFDRIRQYFFPEYFLNQAKSLILS